MTDFIQIPMCSSLDEAQQIIARQTIVACDFDFATAAKVLRVDRGKLRRMLRGLGDKPSPKSLDRGRVYCIRDDGRDQVKIGISSSPRFRANDLQLASGSDLRILHEIGCHDREEARRLEAFLHFEFAQYRRRGEWFSDSDHLVSAAFLPRVEKWMSGVSLAGAVR